MTVLSYGSIIDPDQLHAADETNRLLFPHLIDADDIEEEVQEDCGDEQTQQQQQQQQRMVSGIAGGCLIVLLLASLGLTALTPSISLLHQNSISSRKKNYHLSKQRFYDQQLIDHNNPSKGTWTQRYYMRQKYFAGPGHPIILEIGGEEGNDVGFFYSFIDEVLAQQFKALVVHPEHRFYGISQPVENPTNEQLLELLRPEQAMLDMLGIVNHFREYYGCSLDRTSKNYCPVITVGGSYPAFLAVMMRVLYPDQIDIAYGSSAPLKLYDHSADPNGYYDIISNVADLASPGCRAAVKKTLIEVDNSIRNCTNENFADFAYEMLNVCPGSIPKYIDNSQLFAEEIMQIIESSFADADMIGNYPPSDHTWFAGLCHVFQDETNDSFGRVRDFWKHLEVQDTSVSCFRMDFQLSSGEYSRISGADWSGSGPGWDGRMWDFQCCVDLIPEMNFSEESMFPRRDWTYEWLTQHCVERFGVVGDPMGMVKKWHFDDLVALGASKILFVNGGKDMWKAGSWLEDLSDSILAVNMPNGAHHSEVYALDDDTPDIKAAQKRIKEILSKWLDEIKQQQK